jgi:arginyl-tRNA synthetase
LANQHDADMGRNRLKVQHMNIFRQLGRDIQQALAAELPNLPPDAFAKLTVEPPRDPSHGDVASNAALVLAKPAGRKPQDLAARLVAILAGHPWVASAAPAGPGFVNITLTPEILRAQVPAILRAGRAYGDSDALAAQSINVEYVSANPTGPMHIGHCRGAIVGDAVAALLAKAGAKVTREYYINDAGAQVVALAWAAYWRYLQALGTPVTEAEFSALAPGGLQYGGDYLIPVGASLAAAHGTALAEPGARPADPKHWLDVVRRQTVDAMMTIIRADLISLGIRHDVFSSEAALVDQGAVAKVLSELEAAGKIYVGVLEPPKGKTPDDWEPRPQTLFRTTQYGDEVDRPLRKSDGSFTYFANDIAYHADKLSRGFKDMIVVLGADHGGYVRRMQAAVAALSENTATYEGLLCQIVRLLKDGAPYKPSKRAGNFIAVADVVEELGRDVLRFMMLIRKSDAQMELDIAKAQESSKDNPVFYVQYAHARCRSVLRHAGLGHANVSLDSLPEADLSLLTDDAEMSLIRALLAWPRVCESAALMREPHRVPYYLGDVAAAFHALWNKGRDDAALRFIQDSDPVGTRARLALVAATATVIASGLSVLGVTPVEEMR